MSNFNKVNPKQSFPELEKQIEQYWEENNTFEKSIRNRENAEEFNFYDGPPFATGLPHYGHLLAGTIKDVIPRYQTMKGKKVERIFGWDCHGLPIENLVEKKLNISGRDDIEKKVGIDNFNETCRENVLLYTQEWKKIVKRMGRWVDIDHPYIAMDKDFMESVWWVFKKIYEKGYIYEGNKVVPYCPRCSTSLSNFEVAQGYKDKSDKTITVKFKIGENRYILAWTTTPWTLVANTGLAVGEDIQYVEIKDKSNGEQYILAKDRLKNYYKDENDYEILKEYTGKDLSGIKYEPLLNELIDKNSESVKLGKNAYTVVVGHHVTTGSGTGIVHIAPSYGEDDFIIGEKEDLGSISHIGDNGKTHSLKSGFNDKWVFDFNEEMIAYLKKQNKVVKIESITHSYPHCWRCGTPLVYRTIPAWYVKVSSIKNDLINSNKKISWVPKHIGTGRFGKWLENARDWNISRNRYWATPIPVWQDEEKKETLVIGSIEELYDYNKDFGDITKVIFIRHGRTDYNDLGLMDYQDKAKLNEVGKKQAEEIAKKLGDQKIDKIFSSPLSRCVDTISPLAKKVGVEIEKIEEFSEIKSPDLQGKKFSCKNYKWDNGYGGGEKISEKFEVLSTKFKEIINENKGKTIVICSHADPIVLMRKFISDFDYDTQKYTSGKYPENNPKYGIEKMNAIEYVFSDTGKEVDLHKHFVDKIKVKSPKTGKTLKRVSELLDVWFDSGSMPYSLAKIIATRKYNMSSQDFFSKMEQIVNYVKENNKSYDYRTADIEKDLKDVFKFPANFIAEGQDQTRGWFYTLMVIGNILFKNTPYYNVIVNGIILAEDGKKMSKSLKNYPDPMDVVSKYGADSVRFYMMNSPAVQAQELKFSERGVEETMRKVILPLWNTYYFFTTYANIDNFDPEKDFTTERENKLDIWIISELNQLIKNVDDALGSYTINESTKYIVDFMDSLTNWYIRRSRRRFWKSENDKDKFQAFSTLYEVLVKFTQVLAPISSFITDYIYKDLTKEESVHLSDWPKCDDNLIDEKLNYEMKLAQNIVSLGLSWRARNKIRTRQPLHFVKITEDLPEYYKNIIKDELNVKDVIVSYELAKKIVKPDGRKIGPKYKNAVQDVIKNAKLGNFEELEDGKVKINGDTGEYILEKDEYTVEFIPSDENLDLETGFGIVVALDKNITDDLLKEGYTRDLVRYIQELRKKANYNVDDRIKVEVKGDEFIKEVLKEFKDYIEKETLSTMDNISDSDITEKFDIEDKKVIISLKK